MQSTASLKKLNPQVIKQAHVHLCGLGFVCWVPALFFSGDAEASAGPRPEEPLDNLHGTAEAFEFA